MYIPSDSTDDIPVQIKQFEQLSKVLKFIGIGLSVLYFVLFVVFIVFLGSPIKAFDVFWVCMIPPFCALITWAVIYELMYNAKKQIVLLTAKLPKTKEVLKAERLEQLKQQLEKTDN